MAATWRKFPFATNSDIEKGLKAYFADLLAELDRELTDVFPEAKDLLYYFLDAPSVISQSQLLEILTSAKIETDSYEKVIDFLLYHGVLGIHAADQEHFIYSVNYDLKVLKIRAERAGGATRYILNPAFWPALGIDEGVIPA